MTDNLLRFYFEYMLYMASYFPPPACYSILPITGHWFRDWETYSAATASKGVLFHTVENLQKCLGITQKQAKKILRDFLQFESRYVLENNWIKSWDTQKLKASFSFQTQEILNASFFARQAVICTLHSANLFALAALLYLLHQNITMILAIIPESMPAGTNPLHENGIRMLMSWKDRQPLIPANMQAARKTLREGNSICLAPDTPGYKDKGIMVNFFNQTIWVPVGAAKLAQEFDLPIIVAIPWARNSTSKYEVVIQEIDTCGTLKQVMQRIFQVAEQAILKNPACWMGWLCLNQMVKD